MAKTFAGFVAMVLGVVSLFASLRLGTDPELGGAHRAMAAGALAPLGVACLIGSHRLMRGPVRSEAELQQDAEG